MIQSRSCLLKPKFMFFREKANLLMVSYDQSLNFFTYIPFFAYIFNKNDIIYQEY